MREIYSNAKEVVLWLGCVNPSRCKRDEHGRDRCKYERSAHLGLLPDQELAMEVFNRKWFSRTWLQQEAILATDIVVRYKARHLSWKHLAGLARSIRQNSSKLFDQT